MNYYVIDDLQRAIDRSGRVYDREKIMAAYQLSLIHI